MVTSSIVRGKELNRLGFLLNKFFGRFCITRVLNKNENNRRLIVQVTFNLC